MLSNRLMFDPAGICLFTYHKYRKSIDSMVPLDAHGNPLGSDEALDEENGLHSRSVSVEEMQPLAQLPAEPRASTVRSLGSSSWLLAR